MPRACDVTGRTARCLKVLRPQPPPPLRPSYATMHSQGVQNAGNRGHPAGLPDRAGGARHRRYVCVKLCHVLCCDVGGVSVRVMHLVCWLLLCLISITIGIYIHTHAACLLAAGRAVKAGVTTDEIDRIVYEACIERCVNDDDADDDDDVGSGGDRGRRSTRHPHKHATPPTQTNKTTQHRDAYPSPLNYYRFPKSVCTSVNEVRCLLDLMGE